jgi:hypothetical protein
MSDHVKALAELKQVASQTGITLPTTPNATQQSQAAELEIADGSSTAVKNFASVYLPVAKMHLQMAESGSCTCGRRPCRNRSMPARWAFPLTSTSWAGGCPPPANWSLTATSTGRARDVPAALFTGTGPRLVIMTCGGPFDSATHHYDDNVVVYASPASNG